MKRLFGSVLVIGVLGLFAYATLVSHAQRPCLVTKTDSCAKYLQQSKK